MTDLYFTRRLKAQDECVFMEDVLSVDESILEAVALDALISSH